MDCNLFLGLWHSCHSNWLENILAPVTHKQCTNPSYTLSVGESVFARCLSSLKDERVTASKSLKGPSAKKYEGDRKAMVEHIRQVGMENSRNCHDTSLCCVWFRLSMLPRLCRMLRASCCWEKQPRNTNGNSTMGQLPSCGEEAASSGGKHEGCRYVSTCM